MKALLVSLLISHAPMNMGRKASASFVVTVSVVRRVTVGAATIVYAYSAEAPAPRIEGDTVIF